MKEDVQERKQFEYYTAKLWEYAPLFLLSSVMEGVRLLMVSLLELLG